MSSIVTVSQINKYLSIKLKNDIKLRSVTVRGEISDFNVNFRSGHAYFTLKDETSVLRGIMFSRNAGRLGFSPCQGMKVLCTGNIEVYEPGGAYQIIASELFPEGVGEQHRKLSVLKERLRERGVFSQELKKPLPRLPERIALVTSVSSAAVHDVQNILKRRYPLGELYIYPALVQGEAAQKSICAALSLADSGCADVIILARGGGSEEDLAPFNTEQVTLAVFSCKTPIITAIGHETDTTLADYASDRRASTPSAAAEICAEPIETLIAALVSVRNRLDAAYGKFLSGRMSGLDPLRIRLKAAAPQTQLLQAKQELKLLRSRLMPAVSKEFQIKVSGLERIISSLDALSPYKVLERGYTITLKDGEPVTKTDQISAGSEVTIKFSGFTADAVITSVSGDNR